MRSVENNKFMMRRQAFSLIELLTVIAIIGVLAALLLPTAGAIKSAQLKKRAQTELSRIDTAIQGYHDALGYYPPSNTNNLEINQLYFELLGTTYNQANKLYKTLDNGAQIYTDDLATALGSSVAGFLNCTKDGDESSKPARSFISNLGPNQSQPFFTNAAQTAVAKLLVCTVGGPANSTGLPGVNPWRYNSNNPTNNPGSYDLWVDILVRGKTNRISNWSKQPQIVR